MAKLKNPPKDPLDAFVEAANADPKRAIAIMLWRARMTNPDMYVRVEEKDLQGLADCVNYLKVKPAILIHREQGQPAQPGLPATKDRRAVPPRMATAPKPYAVIALVEQDKNGNPTMNMIKPVENNQEDYDRSLEVAAIQRARDMAPDLAQRLVHASRTGDFSSSDLQEAASALELLAKQ